jgi:spermidine synthase
VFQQRQRAFLLAYAAVTFLLSALQPVSAQDLGQLVLRKNSLYHEISVYKRGSVVTLQFGRRNPNVFQSQVDVSDLRRHLLEYSAMTFSGLLYVPEPKRVLLVGLGGGVIPREMHHYFPQAAVDVVEIDPEILSIAQEHFGFRPDDRLRVHIADGRVFIRNQLRQQPVPKYDIIILDAFNSEYIPFHLMTKEFLEEVKGVLAEDGVVVANVFYANRLFDAEAKTYLEAFGRCQAFYGVHSGNAMLIALGAQAPTLTSGEAVDRATELQEKHAFTFDLPAIADEFRPAVRLDSRATVLTDDRAPVDWLRTQETPRTPEAR